jgi:hypothetical protein
MFIGDEPMTDRDIKAVGRTLRAQGPDTVAALIKTLGGQPIGATGVPWARGA